MEAEAKNGGDAAGNQSVERAPQGDAARADRHGPDRGGRAAPRSAVLPRSSRGRPSLAARPVTSHPADTRSRLMVGPSFRHRARTEPGETTERPMTRTDPTASLRLTRRWRHPPGERAGAAR